MSFAFVNSAPSCTDQKSRRLIRSHAAKGKNIGKVRQPRPRPSPPEARYLAPAQALRTARDMAASTGPIAPGTVDRPVEDGLSAISFSGEMTPKTRRLVQRVFSFVSGLSFPPELSHAVDFDMSHSIWIQYIFRDEAYFNCTVALATAAVGPNPMGLHDAEEAAAQLVRTYRLLNDKLSGDDALSDTAVAAVTAMTQFERIQGRYTQGLVHFEGLLRLVELRGGISRVAEDQPLLAQKVFRADLELALQMGTIPRFGAELVPGKTTMTWLRSRLNPGEEERRRGSQVFIQLSVKLQEIMLDSFTIAWLFNTVPAPTTRLGGDSFYDSLILLGYRLAHLSPLGQPFPSSPLENLLRLGLLAFAMTLMVGFDGRPTRSSLLSQVARRVLQEYSPVGKTDQEALLWALTMGRISIFGREDDLWLLPILNQTASALDLSSWDDICPVLYKFPWVNGLHNRAITLLQGTTTLQLAFSRALSNMATPSFI